MTVLKFYAYAYADGDPISGYDPLGLYDVYAAVWASEYFSGSVGHVFLGDPNGQTLTSQFPDPHGMEGANTTLSWNDTLDKGGRITGCCVPNSPSGQRRVHCRASCSIRES